VINVTEEKTWYEEALERNEKETQGDYETDVEYWDRTPGQHKIKILKRGEEYEADFGNGTQKRVSFEVEVDGLVKKWPMNLKFGDKSPYMKIATVIHANGGIPEGGLPVMVIISGKGKETEYAVVDLQSV
jgi:hypothetical protein